MIQYVTSGCPWIGPEDPHGKLCTVNDASQNNHELELIQEPFCVCRSTDTQAHIPKYPRCACVVCYLHYM